MKIYLKETVLEAARKRIAWLFDEFENVVVSISGGKDSTVVYNLTLAEAERRGRLPLGVLFVDQEAEWRHAIDFIRDRMHDPRVKPIWFQGSFVITNGTSNKDGWIYCWRHGDEWMREKEPDSIHENDTGVIRFHALHHRIARPFYQGRIAYIAGVRADESPARGITLTQSATYKDVTWGCRSRIPGDTEQFTFYPIYDWSFTDVWKAIHDHGWPYCKIYDFMYQHGVPIRQMRISNLHHETGLRALKILQVIEPDTWDKMAGRVKGIRSYGSMSEAYTCPSKLPPMFGSWEEYRDHLLLHLVPDADKRERFLGIGNAFRKQFHEYLHPKITHMEIASILVNDYEGAKFAHFGATYASARRKAGKKGGWSVTTP